jgi:hypothetical protein
MTTSKSKKPEKAKTEKQKQEKQKQEKQKRRLPAGWLPDADAVFGG